MHFKFLSPTSIARDESKGRDFLPQIDGLRFVAIMGVLAYHVHLVLPYHQGLH